MNLPQKDRLINNKIQSKICTIILYNILILSFYSFSRQINSSVCLIFAQVYFFFATNKVNIGYYE